MAPGASPYRGFYINLDRSLDRRARMEDQLRQFGLTDLYERFPAIDGRSLKPSGSPLKPGEIGVFLSHYEVLKRSRALGKCIHVVEDDVLLTRHVRPVLEEAIAATNVFQHYDLLFTDSVVNCHFGLLKNLTAAFDEVVMPASGPVRLSDLKLMDLASVFYAAFSSYVVAAASIERLLALYEQELSGGLKTPVDIFIQQQVLAGKLRAGCLFPFLTSSGIEDHSSGSTIAAEEERARPAVVVMSVLKYLFLIGRDLDHAKRLLDRATLGSRTKTSQHHALLTQVTEFILSKDFEEF